MVILPTPCHIVGNVNLSLYRECPVLFSRLHGLHSSCSHIRQPLQKRLHLRFREQDLQLHFRAKVRLPDDAVKGRHFNIPQMRAADEIVVVTSHDHLITVLEGTSGDYNVKLDQGVRATTEVDDNGALKEVVANEVLDWRLSPKTRVVINRAVPAIGERMSVHTMAFDASGEKRSDRVFCEGRSELNSGELVVKPIDNEKIAEQASEAAETTEESVEEDSEESSSDSSESSEDSSSEEE